MKFVKQDDYITIQVVNLYSFTYCYSRLNQFEKALDAAGKAILMAKEMQDTSKEMLILKQVMDIYEKQQRILKMLFKHLKNILS
jgi:hypothetical protein